MVSQTVNALSARGLAGAGLSGLAGAGLSLFVIVASMSVLGAEESSLDKLTIRGLDGHRVSLAAPDHGATAVVFYSTECPISNGYSPTLNHLMDSFPAKYVKWLGVCVDPDLGDSEVATHARDFGLKFPIVRDRNGSLARKLGAKVTPEAFVIDANGKVRYHGRIDDQFVARRKRNANPSASELKDAIAAVLSGKEVPAPEVEAVGCPLPAVPEAARPTYCKDVARILQANCQECHRPGQVGPSRGSRLMSRRGKRLLPPLLRRPKIAPCRPGKPILTWVSNSRTSAPSPTATSRPWLPGPRPTHPRETGPTCRFPPVFPRIGGWARPTW